MAATLLACMSKFDRRLQRRSNICGVTRKGIFKSADAAMMFAADLGSKCNLPVMISYHCLRCGGYHLTSQEYDPVRRSKDYELHERNVVPDESAKFHRKS
jgi:hypothetical protein